MQILHFFVLFGVIFLRMGWCDRNGCEIITKDNLIYILSEQPATAQVAEETCLSYGGRLAQISNQEEKQFLEPHLRSFYIPDELERVSILQKKSRLDSEVPEYVAYKFRIEAGYADTSNIDNFSIPEGNELKSIMLYNRRTNNFAKVVQFCWFNGRDFITEICDQGWMDKFIVYGESESKEDTIQIYNYWVRNHGLTSKLSLNPITDTFFIISRTKPSLFLPDISAFTGARSDINQSSWFWNNGTMITDPTYPWSNTSVCEQMTWPLTYDDGINLRAKDCGTGKSHYICEVGTTLDEVECDGTSLSLFVSHLFVSNATIKVIGSENQTLNFSPGHPVKISGLEQRREYTFRIIFELAGTSIKIHTNSTGTTGYGVPDPVTSAYFENSTKSSCIVIWSHESSDDEDIKYKLKVTTQSGEEFVKELNPIEKSSHRKNELVANVSALLSADEHKNAASFELQAVSSKCGDKSESVSVSGICEGTSQNLSKGSGTDNTIVVMVVVCVILLIILVIVLILYALNISNQQRNPVMKSSENITEPTNYDRPIAAEPTVDPYVQPNMIQQYENMEQERHTYETIQSSEYENV